MQRNRNKFSVDVFRNVEDTDISLRVRDIAPILCIVVVEIVAGATLSVLEILSERLCRCYIALQCRWWSKRRFSL